MVALAACVPFITTGAISQTPDDTIKYHYPPLTTLGTRYAEPWIQVPLSLTYLQQRDLPKGKGYGLDEVLSGVPGVLVQSRYGNQDVRLTIRGFGARGAGERSNAGTSRGVRVLSNGFPETEPDGRTSFDLIDIAGAGGIEVIRSNASSLYGNASGGVINIMSNTTFERPYSSFTESFGSFGFHKEMVDAGALVGLGKFYFSMSNTTSNGWRAHSGSSQTLVSMGMAGPIGDRTTMGVHVSGTSTLFRIPGPLTQAQFDADPSQAQTDTNKTQSNIPGFIQRDERRFNRLGRIGINAAHEFDDNNTIAASTFVQPKFLQRSERNTYREFNRYHVGGSLMYKNRVMVGRDIENVLLIGSDEAYQDGAILFYNRYNVNPAIERGTLRDNKREGANNFGAFLQDEISFGESWLALLGFRYDNITYYSESYVDLRLHDTKSYNRVTPKAGITYRLSPTQSIYASLGGGIEVPAGNETDPSGTYGLDTIYAINPLLEPIRSTTIELGTKQIVGLGPESFAHFTYDVALYWLQVSNDIIPYRGGRFYFTAGKTERMGVEAGGNVQFKSGLSANVAITISNNKYKEYRVDSAYSQNNQALAGRFVDYANNTMAGVPNMFYTIGVKYTVESLKGAYVRAALQGMGKYYADDANSLNVPAYAIINAGIGIDHLDIAGSGLFVTAFCGVNNLTDKKYVASAWLNPDLNLRNQPMFLEPGLPRNVVASIGLGVNM